MGAINRATEVLRRLPDGPVVGAEIGIWKGKMSSRLLQRPDLKLYMVDHWLEVAGYEEGIFSAENQENNKRTAELATSFAKNRRVILHMPSADASERVTEPLDFVYIDGDHSYNGVYSDIENWIGKIKDGGLIGGHDYNNPSEVKTLEVVAAVNDAAIKYGLKIETAEGANWFARIKK